MGKGNVGVAGAYEGLFYIDNEDFHVYRRNDDLDDWPETRLMRDLDYAELTGDGWLFDEEGTANEEDDVLECSGRAADFQFSADGARHMDTEWRVAISADR
ncbi:MAG: hypothetical protein ACLSB9_21405 [Hydrogeniiclostridium mannosilyticum]